MPISSENEVGGLRGSLKRTVLFDLDAASEFVGDVEPLGFRIEEHVPPPTVLAKLYGVPAIGALEAGEAHPAMQCLAIQEALEGFVEPVGRRLHRALRDMLSAASLETIHKFVAAKELASFLVMSLEHLQHLVVEEAAIG
jgi:hypothetical protein